MFPAWYGNGDPDRGGFPDAEELLQTFFDPQLNNVIFVPWLPTPDTIVDGATYEEHLNADRAFLRIARTGGRINFEENRDEPRVQLAVIAKSRQMSWRLIEFCRQVLWEGFKRAAVVPNTTHMLQTSEEVLGPQMIPENIVEPRLVPATFGLYTWKPKGLPNYRQALGL